MAGVGFALELFERFLDLIGEIEEELGLTLDVGQRPQELDRGGRADFGLARGGSLARPRPSCLSEARGPLRAGQSIFCRTHGSTPSSCGSAEPSTTASKASQTSPTR